LILSNPDNLLFIGLEFRSVKFSIKVLFAFVCYDAVSKVLKKALLYHHLAPLADILSVEPHITAVLHFLQRARLNFTECT
jgi:hypothetical protein